MIQLPWFKVGEVLVWTVVELLYEIWIKFIDVCLLNTLLLWYTCCTYIKGYDTLFLVACTRLYKPLCWLVGWLVGRSVAVHDARNLWRSTLFFLCKSYILILYLKKTHFLVACTQLYKLLCWLVRCWLLGVLDLWRSALFL